MSLKLSKRTLGDWLLVAGIVLGAFLALEVAQGLRAGRQVEPQEAWLRVGAILMRVEVQQWEARGGMVEFWTADGVVVVPAGSVLVVGRPGLLTLGGAGEEGTGTSLGAAPGAEARTAPERGR